MHFANHIDRVASPPPFGISKAQSESQHLLRQKPWQSVSEPGTIGAAAWGSPCLPVALWKLVWFAFAIAFKQNDGSFSANTFKSLMMASTWSHSL